jgi:hypothetical protein
MEVIIVAFKSFHSTPAEYGEPNMVINRIMESTTEITALCIGAPSAI